MNKISLNKASKVLCISRDVLKSDVRTGRLMMSDGCLDCEELRCLYPEAYEESTDIEYYEAIKETAGKWKDDARDYVEKMEKSLLVQRIRKLEAENHMLKKKLDEKRLKL